MMPACSFPLPPVNTCWDLSELGRVQGDAGPSLSLLGKPKLLPELLLHTNSPEKKCRKKERNASRNSHQTKNSKRRHVPNSVKQKKKNFEDEVHPRTRVKKKNALKTQNVNHFNLNPHTIACFVLGVILSVATLFFSHVLSFLSVFRFQQVYRGVCTFLIHVYIFTAAILWVL